MSAVLVTGGAGFIGSHLCEKLLEEGKDVICLDNFNDSYDPKVKRENIQRSVRHSCYRLIEGDILDRDLVDKIMSTYPIDTVVHLAALAGVRKSIQSPLDYIDVDIKGTVLLLEACKNKAACKFIFASSSSVYGNLKPPFREDMQPDAQSSPYAGAKHAAELFCRTYSLLYGIPAVCLRFFTVYGPRQRPDMAIHIFTKAIDEGKEVFIYGDGNSSRDYTYVGDVVSGITAAMNLECGFEVINLGNSRPVNIMELIKIIESKVGKKANIRLMPFQQGDVAATCADLNKARALLGYSPSVTLEDGIDKFVNWYRKTRACQDSVQNTAISP